MPPRGQPEKLDRILEGLLTHTGGPDVGALVRIRRDWPDLVGPALAGHTRPVGFERGRLTVATDHAVFNQELKLGELDLKRAIEARTGRRVERLLFRNERGAAPAARAASDPGADAPVARPHGAEEAQPDELGGIRDPDLAASLAKLKQHVRTRTDGCKGEEGG